MEQEYFIVDPKTKLPLGFSNGQAVEPQGKYYCGVGINRVFLREIPENHMEYCLYAGIKICGINAEVAPDQWEYQIGPCVGIEAGDHLWVSRYILNRVAEAFGLLISYHPKPLGKNNDWNGSGCHTNFSTKQMREEGGMQYIVKACEKLSKKHTEHINVYGLDNDKRLTGKHETSGIHEFSFGYSTRDTSIRIPAQAIVEGRGYFEDRRPASNCDPYLVSDRMLQTIYSEVETEA